MAEEFQAAGICGGNWWMNSCSMGINSDLGAYGSYLMADLDLRPRSSCKDYSCNNIIYTNTINPRLCPGEHGSMVFQSPQKPHQQADSNTGGNHTLMDSNFHMMGFNFSSTSSSSSPDWSQALLRSGSNIMQEDMNMGLNQEIQKDWSSDPNSFTSEEDLSMSPFKTMNHQDFSIEQQRLNNSLNTSSNNTPTATSQGFPMGPSTFGYTSPLIQSLFEPDPEPSLFTNRTMNYYGTNQQHTTGFHFSNNTPFWNASAACSFDDVKSSFLPPSQPIIGGSALEEKPNCNNMPTKSNTNEEVRNSGSVMKKGSEHVFKRPRIETPSPLPPFKVRKEKLGDRVTALQQLVSPFGKTDTASVLHEAIEYIKFLHDQVSALSTPYLKNGNPIQHRQASVVFKESEEAIQDLRSRGLCLVPISSTFPVASETASDFWTPTFGGTFRCKDKYHELLQNSKLL